MSCRTISRFLLTISLIALAAMLAVPTYAQFTDPTTIFEVGDGNSAPGGSAANCDWDTLNGTNGADTNTPAAICAGDSGTLNAYGFLAGSTNEKNFTTGGSKDPLDINNWKWSAGSTPDKDTLTNGYAASYLDPSGHKTLVFGSERFAVNGDANIGIWFFQQTVAPNSSNGFDGLHTKNDVFAVSAFTNGGGHPELDVYFWDPACNKSHYASPAAVGACADTNLRLKFSGTGSGLCSNDPGCATVNGSVFTPTWPYATKFGGGTAVPVNGFFEGGFDLSFLFGGASTPCFSSFLLETRSSQSTSAVLKDFLSGSFPECKISVSKSCQCSAFHADGSGYDYSAGGSVSNEAGSTVYNASVTDEHTLTYSCGTLNPKGTAGAIKFWGSQAVGKDPSLVCTGSSGTFQATTLGGFTNTVNATATTSQSGGSTINADADTESCTFSNPGPCIENPTLSVDKTCVTGLEHVGNNVVVRVDYVGTVTNTGSVDLTNVSVTDNDTGTPSSESFSIGTLAVGKTKCYTNGGAATCPTLVVPAAGDLTISGAAHYYPSTLSGPAGVGGLPTDPKTAGRAIFPDTVQATGTDALNPSKTVNSDAITRSCLVCPNGFCPI